MNAGAYGWEFSDILSSIEVYNLSTKNIETLHKDDIKFSYRTSSNLENKIIISATTVSYTHLTLPTKRIV